MIDNPFVTNGYVGPEFFCDRVEETAINTNVNNVQPATGIIYNLQGQAVKSTVKGLYIQNGKKFIVK